MIPSAAVDQRHLVGMVKHGITLARVARTHTLYSRMASLEEKSGREWSRLNAEVLFKLLILFVFVVLVYCVVTRHKAVHSAQLGVPIRTNASATTSGRNADRHNMSHMHAIAINPIAGKSDRVRRHRSWKLGAAHQPTTSQTSSLSLPTYESIDNRSLHVRCITEATTPSPSYDQLPLTMRH